MRDPLLAIIARSLNPFIFVYGLYIIFYGDVSPGGGFAGGVVVATSFILFKLAFVSKDEYGWFGKIGYYLATKQFFLFVVVGVVSFGIGLTFLSVIFPLGMISDAIAGWFKTGIGFMVAMSIVLIFYTLSEGGKDGTDTKSDA